MNNPLQDWFTKTFKLDLPEFSSLDDSIDYILPRIAPFSEDLYETKFYTEKPWLEIRDDDNFLDAVLHIFKQYEEALVIKASGEDQGPNYLISIDGNVQKGVWAKLEGQNSNVMLIKTPKNYELYKKVFINRDFFILQKHGNKHLSGKQRKYFVMAREGRIKNMEWREVTEVLFNIYRYRVFFILILVIFGLILAIIVFFSFS